MSETLKSSVFKLADLMKARPDMTDRSLLSQGQDILSVFIDPNFGSALKHFDDSLCTLYVETIQDLANGAPLLNGHHVGLFYKNGKFIRYSIPFEHDHSPGNIVCSIKLKSRKAFQKFRTDSNHALDQDQIQAAIYLLISRLSTLKISATKV